MKRELKVYYLTGSGKAADMIARPIPMKRELKDMYVLHIFRVEHANCKAHPDEKGTERQGLGSSSGW